MTNQSSGRKINLQRIYIKDVSLESPLSPAIFQKQWKPKINLDINAKNIHIEEDYYDVVLSITVTAEQDEKNAFLIEVQQAGVFIASGFDKETLRQVLNTTCPNILFPYARETIDNLVVKAGFPPLMLAPVNFDALYQQAMTEMQQASKETETSTKH